MRVLIVDDEPLARERVRELLRSDPEVASVAECGNGKCALDAILADKPDLLFLDVQMPVMDGFQVLEALDHQRVPLVIFVTAYDQYAVRAFEVHAVDYLVKPFDRARFLEALTRAKRRLVGEGADHFRRQIQALLSELRPSAQAEDRLVVKSARKILLLKTAEIDWIEAEGNYVRLHVGSVSHLHRDTLADLEARLDPRRFRRIHRSVIVNVDRIKELVSWFRKDFRVILHDGTKLTLSRSYKDRVQDLLRRTGSEG